MRFRTPSKKSKYHVPREDYITAVHWSLRYPDWTQELKTLPDTSKGIDYSLDKVQSSNNYDSTMETAIRREELTRKVNLLESTVREVSGDLYEWVLKSVTLGLNYWQLQQLGMPATDKDFYDKRQHYYYLLSKRI